ncbi:hypothetical protein L208DRAFT_1376676 [Tricholoma matsutake]|nr:hypothetical protein L208DRAFT_1376676 [Tricholoma matsutake 945]
MTLWCLDFYKSVMVQAQRLQLEQEDFDVTHNTILDSQLYPEHFDQIKVSILTNLKQFPSMIKAHFSWTWQCMTLNHGDELANLLLLCIQPHQLEPLLLCGWLGLVTLTVVEKGSLVHVHLVFGKTVEKPTSPEGLQKMYENFLSFTTITTSKKLHLAHHTMPTVMEDMGVTMDQVDAVGHWAGNTQHEIYADKIPRNAVIALAGFYVGEAYRVPWAEVPVPDELQLKVFPFVEDALSHLQTRNSKINQGTVNFLELLQQLCPFFWRILACLHQEFQDCLILNGLQVTHCAEARLFFEQWPAAHAAAEQAFEADHEIVACFQEETTQSAFMSISAQQKDLEQVVHTPVLGLQPTDLSLLIEHQTVHLPILVTHAGGTFHVLPLSPPPLCTPFDLILPPPIAFCAPGSASSAQYPVFNTGHCSWHAIFKLILQPDMLWDTWGPWSLGAYPDVKSLWETWDEGASIDGVGRGPPLQLVESEWGHHKDKRTGKGKLPAWQPCKNEMVCSSTMVTVHIPFVKRIQHDMTNSKMASIAIEDLEDLCAGRTLPQLQVALQPKG